jgi:periplasmic copper chaperone A
MTKLITGLLAALLCTSVYAADIQVEGAWTRETLPGQNTAMVYMSITSKQAAVLTGVESSAAKAAGMHNMEHKAGMMTMREVKSISLPANQRMEFGMHGYHLLLDGLKAPLKTGAKVPLTLLIEMPDKRIIKTDVQAEVRPLKDAAQK